MFDFEKDQATVSGPGTVVGANVKLTGIIKDVNDITIHGNVEGEVISDKNVLVTETASIKGPVTANVVTVSGKVNGAITANQKLEINPTGKAYGSIKTRDLIIHSGAIFVGKSETLKDETEVKKVAKVEKKEEFIEEVIEEPVKEEKKSAIEEIIEEKKADEKTKDTKQEAKEDTKYEIE